MSYSQWNEKRLDKCVSDFIDYRGKTVPKSEAGILLITARNVRMGFVDWSHNEYIPEESYDSWMDRGIPKAGDILFTTEAPLGNIALFPRKGKYALGQRLITIRADEYNLHGGFLLYFLLSSQGQNRIRVRATGSTALGIRQSELRKLKIPLPPLAEQKKIAAILSTWDDAIALVESLIVALTERKRGLMQRLLTGEMRFPGFDDEWEEVRLDRVLDIQYGKSPSEVREENGQFPIWGTSGIVGRTNEILCDRPAVIIGRKGTIDTPYLASEPFWAIDTTFYGVPQNNIDVRWVYYVLDHKKLERFNESSGVPSLLRNTLNTIKIVIPQRNEQISISEVIETCDREMQLFKEKRNLIYKQKKGLMQRLLTGEVRVEV